jgi:hypothetical protein
MTEGHVVIAYLLAVFATYRVARILAMEDGPADVFQRIRERIDPTGEQKTSLARGVNCPLCVGVYVAFLMACLVPFQSWQMFVLAWFGIAGAQTLLHLGAERWFG